MLKGRPFGIFETLVCCCKLLEHGRVVFDEWVLLTAGGDHGDHDRGGGGGALHQHSGQHAHHQPRHRVGQQRVPREHIARRPATQQQ